MPLQKIKENLTSDSIFFSEDSINNLPTVIGYDKQFRWSWMATQLNTFIVATDYGAENISCSSLEMHLEQAFNYAKINYSGWPRGLQSGFGVIAVLISSNCDEEAVEYCKKLKSGKKWAAFTIPVIINSSTQEAHYFEKNPMWGRIYYPYFKERIEGLL